MALQRSAQGILYIVAGVFLFVFAGGKFILQVLAALAGLVLINYGLSMRGLPPISVLVQQWLEELRR